MQQQRFLLAKRVARTIKRRVSLSSAIGKGTQFGYSNVSEEEKAEKVGQVFSSVAEKYDLMNDIMSFGIHRCWKEKFVDLIRPRAGERILDVAGGTGDIAFQILRKTSRPTAKCKSSIGSNASLTVCDINKDMLNVGKRRAVEKGICEEQMRWICADCEKLPFGDSQFDAYTIAFGIRNCTNIVQVLREAFRVLKPTGRFYCLEFSHVQNPLLRRMYDLYSFEVIPVFGHLIASDWRSYQYLVESIRLFPQKEEFAKMISDAGFKSVIVKKMAFGAVSVHSGRKLVPD